MSDNPLDLFDRRRCRQLQKDEEQILEALDRAYRTGAIQYVFYSTARDVTAARASALSWVNHELWAEREARGEKSA